MKVQRAIECAVLFLVAPTLIALAFEFGWLPTRALFPILWLLTPIVLVPLLRDPTFDRRLLWNWAGARGHWGFLAARFALAIVSLTVLLAVYEPQRLLSLPRENPRLWAIIMIGYPILSVYAQEIAFRTFFFHRYRELFASPRAMLIANALAFGYAHVLMRNWLAVGFAIIGGAVFAHTYQRTRSTAAVSIEHAVYGCFLFTIGWGWYFYAGAPR